MAIIRFTDRPFFRNPWTEFEKMRREMDMLTRGVAGGSAGGEVPTVYPALVVSENEATVFVRAEMAGVKAADLDISVEGETLLIKGERKPAGADEKVSFHRREIEYGRFSRAITLPTRINLEAIGATMKDGILSITLPKAEEVKPRQVRVNVG